MPYINVCISESISVVLESPHIIKFSGSVPVAGLVSELKLWLSYTSILRSMFNSPTLGLPIAPNGYHQWALIATNQVYSM